MLLNIELHRIAESLYKIQKKYFYQYSATIKHRGYYYHSMCTDIEVRNEKLSMYYEPENSDDIIELLRDFMNCIYSALQKEYDYLISDESIKETLISNEYEFTKEGDIS